MLFSLRVAETTNTLVVYVTAPEQEAARIARSLVERRLVACVNVLAAVRSFYHWEGQVQDDPESLLIAKTTAARFESLRQAIIDLHPYDLPEVIATPITEAHAPYRAWIHSEVEGPA